MKYLICSAATAGGIGRHTVGVSKALTASGDETHVIVPSTNAHLNMYSQNEITVTAVPAEFGDTRLDTPDHIFVYSILYLLVMPVSFFRNRPEILYCTSWFPCGLIGALISVFFDVQLVVVAHGGEIKKKNDKHILNGLVASMQEWVFSTADNVFAVSEFTASRLQELGFQEIYVCQNGIDPDRFVETEPVDIQSEYGLDSRNSKLLLTVSRLKNHKGHETVIRSLEIVLRQHPEVTYAIAGSGNQNYANRLRSIASELGVAKNVVFLDYVPDKHLPALYEKCDVYTMPSIASPEGVEGFGISYLEAGVCGTPVIGTTSGGASSFINHGINGFLIEPSDHEALAAHIDNLLSEPDLREEMWKQNQQLVIDEYTWDQVIEGMKEKITCDGN